MGLRLTDSADCLTQALASPGGTYGYTLDAADNLVGQQSPAGETGGIRADYRYAGLVNHAQSGLYLAHYRAYSPQAGRWIGRDPIRETGGGSLYAYVNGSPLSYVDPTGEYGLPGIVAGAGIEAAVQAYKIYKAGCNVFDIKNYNLYDIAFAAVAGAVTPGWATVGKNSVYWARAVSTLSRMPRMKKFHIWLVGIFVLGLLYAWLKTMVGEISFFAGAIGYLLLLRLVAERLGK